MGALQFKVNNWQPLLQQAKSKGWIKGTNDGLAARFFAFAQNTQTNGPLPVTLGFKDGIFAVGSVPADTLSPLY